MAIVTMRQLLEAGIHFGHQTRRWNPKMRPYIFGQRNGIYIIDLQKTLQQVRTAYACVRDTVAAGGSVLFVGTKKQAQETVAQEAQRCSMPFINERWLGGTLTNWRTIRQRIDQLEDLERKQKSGEFTRLTKKETLEKQRLIVKLDHRLGGLRSMTRLPDILFITDTRREALAVTEANKLGIPIIAMLDTNCDPDPIDLVIPANDDAIRAIKLLVGRMADAVIEGKMMRKDEEEEVVIETPSKISRRIDDDEELDDEMLLGDSTRAKIVYEREPEAEGDEQDDQE